MSRRLSHPPAPPAAAGSDQPAGNARTRRTLLGFVGTRRVVEILLTVVLGVGGGPLLFGAHFGLDMVHSQLNAQDFPFRRRAAPR